MARTVDAFLFRSGQFLHFCPESQEEKMRKEDRRVRRTRESLHKALISLALEKNYDSISVQEVLDRADVGRSTFYTHSKAWMNCSSRVCRNSVRRSTRRWRTKENPQNVTRA